MSNDVSKIYDNTNLAESYSGVVTPLTISFAKGVYDGVYRNFLSFMGVSKSTQKTHEDMFPNMVVGIGNHLYYDIRNWYTMVSLLPGYRYNKAFFENMLGIDSDNAEVDTNKQSVFLGWLYRFRLLFQALKIAVVFVLMPLYIRHFNKRFDSMYKGMMSMKLEGMPYDFMSAHVKSLHTRLTKLWRIPIANDFAVMVSIGVARKLYTKWLSEADFVDGLRLSSQAGLATLDPGRLLFKIVEEIERNQEFKNLFDNKEDQFVIDTIFNSHKDSHLKMLIESYIHDFGSRVPNELKLETPTLLEEPVQVVGLIRAVRSFESDVFKKRHRIAERGNNESGKNNLSFVKNFVLKIIILWARRSIQYREETRLRRTQIFGHARQVYLAMGKILTSQGHLEQSSDVMYMTTEEALDYKLYNDLKNKIIKRKEEVVFWGEVNMPKRIETRNSITDIESDIKLAKNKQAVTGAYSLKGSVASRAGQESLSGTALVLKKFDRSQDYKDKILVTKHTDPGWVMVFPFVRAIVVERGGFLSHASVVAREMNIPCIIGVESATDLLENGAKIKLDLVTGHIHEIDKI